MIFLDTGAFIARYIKRDQYHNQAITHWRRLRRDRRPCYTTNFVLDETFTLLARRTNYEFAAIRAHNLLHSTSLIIWRSDHENELAAIDLFRKYADQQVSFTDCISFVLMRKYNVTHAFTFDEHFTYAGFQIEPGGLSD